MQICPIHTSDLPSEIATPEPTPETWSVRQPGHASPPPLSPTTSPVVPRGGPTILPPQTSPHEPVVCRRYGHWAEVESIDSLTYPAPSNGIRPIVDSIPIGHPVDAAINGRRIRGRFEGWDYKARPKIRTSSGFRIAPSWDSLTPIGTVACPPPARTCQGLTTKSILTPPPRLKSALNKAIEQRVTGPHTAAEYYQALANEGYPMYVVGGAIRDAIYLLHDKPDSTDEDVVALMKDIDIVTTAPPNVLRTIAEQIAPEYDGAIFSSDIVDQFGCVLVGGPKSGIKDCAGIDLVSIRTGATDPQPVYHRDTKEYALPTTLGYRLADDVNGRDFTCNSLYYDPQNEVIIDPTGTGIADAQHRWLHLIPSAGEVGIDKVFRFYKFKLRNYTSDPYTTGLIRKAALTQLPLESEGRIIANFCRVAPKQIDSQEQATHFLSQLRLSMREDGSEIIYTRFIEPLEPAIIEEILKRNAHSESSDWWHFLAASAGLGAIGAMAYQLLPEGFAKNAHQAVENIISDCSSRLSEWTGISPAPFSAPESLPAAPDEADPAQASTPRTSPDPTEPD